ncbi:MAG: hypothetical protein WD995_11525 [Gemmatimonadota bacterium]
MRRAAFAVLLTTGLAVVGGSCAPEQDDTSADAEVARIQDHLAEVLRSLRAEVPENLAPGQLAARQTAIGWLEEYRAAGDFPHNHVHPGGRVPVFVDPHGTPCAVGYLMVRSGEHGLVEEIVRTDNRVRVPDLAGDERVAAWLNEHGLTLSEAARIQPTYDHNPGIATVRADYDEPLTVGLSVATAALASYAAMVEPRQATPWLDAVTVGTSVGHAVLLVNAGTNDVEDPGWVVGLNVAGALVGAGSVVLRALGRDESGADASEPRLQAFVSPGRYGTQVGLTVRR